MADVENMPEQEIFEEERKGFFESQIVETRQKQQENVFWDCAPDCLDEAGTIKYLINCLKVVYNIKKIPRATKN